MPVGVLSIVVAHSVNAGGYGLPETTAPRGMSRNVVSAEAAQPFLYVLFDII